MTDWQLSRAMSPREFERTVLGMGLSISAAGRFLGVSERTVRRFISGDANVPVSAVLLLRAMLAFGVKPIAPKRKPRSY